MNYANFLNSSTEAHRLMNLECPNDAIREILHDFEEGTLYIYTIYNTYSTSQSTIWENILRARKIFSRAKGE